MHVVDRNFASQLPSFDPLFAKQWHLTKIGDIAATWRDFTGKGVKVGVYDSGVQIAHHEFADRYDASLHVVVGGKTYDGDYRPASGPHGTAVAGLIGAGRNGVDGVGVAYDVTLTGVNIFDPFSEDDHLPGIYINAEDSTKFFEALRQSAKFDIANHSWGGLALYHESFSRGVSGTARNAMTEAVAHAADTGRGGLGTITVAAAGNTRIDGQADSLKSDRHVITVSAFRELDGFASSYSAYGDHILVSAPSDDVERVGGTGVYTTDLLGRDGYNLSSRPGGNYDYTDAFGGTSAATPIVSGVVALMLDANDSLGWRDVKNILATSATMPTAFEQHKSYYVDEFDFANKLNNTRFELAGQEANWNGGAMHFSGDYGYGAVNVYNAVRMAEVWSLFGDAKTSANEMRFDTGRIDAGLTLPTVDSEFTPPEAGDDFKGTPVGLTFEMKSDLMLEHVDMTVFFNTERGYNERMQATPTGLRFKLTAPDGTTGFVDTSNARAEIVWGDNAAAERSYTFGFSSFRGVRSEGTWTIEFEELFTSFNNQTIIHGFSLSGFGSGVTVDDVYTYTNEFFTMAAITGEDTRRVLSDTNGGVDWINAAAVTANVELSLMEGAIARFGGRDAITIAPGSVVEHAVTGDGNDRLFGNALDNKLFGMRGNDWLNGGAGNDTLFGGQGSDVFAFDTAGVSGRDTVLDWSAGDRIATSKMLRGADQNGVLTVGSSALLLLDGNARGDTAELAGHGGATLQALGKSNGYWWYGFLSEGDDALVDGRVTELTLGQAGRPAYDGTVHAPEAIGVAAPSSTPAFHDTAFFLYDAMGDAMASGVQVYA